MGGEAGDAVGAEGVGGRGGCWCGGLSVSGCCCRDDARVFEGYVQEVDWLGKRENGVHDAG